MEIIAEFGCNWKDYNTMSKMFDRCVDLDIKLVKFQMWKKEQTPDKVNSMYINENLAKSIIHNGKRRGLEVFFTPFYPEAVDILERIGVGIYKIRYNDYYRIDRDIMNKVQETGKSYFISCLSPYLNKGSLPLECVPDYPAPINQYHMVDKEFRGISDHTNTLELYKKALEKPNLKYFEMHVCLDKDCYEAKWSKTFDEIEDFMVNQGNWRRL